MSGLMILIAIPVVLMALLFAWPLVIGWCAGHPLLGIVGEVIWLWNFARK